MAIAVLQDMALFCSGVCYLLFKQCKRESSKGGCNGQKPIGQPGH